MRKTKIVATVGPACENLRILSTLIAEGADVFRINASHTGVKGLAHWFGLVRRAAAASKKPVGILVDLQGPRVRTGLVKNSTMVLEKGAAIEIRIGSGTASGGTIWTSCRPFSKMVKKSDKVLIDNGALTLVVERVSPKSVFCRVLSGGILGENKGINLPNAPSTLPALTAKDLADLKEAARLGADFIALSFVRTGDDVAAAKRWMAKNGVSIPLIAKIEKPSAVGLSASIFEIADGVMVARGDLGIEMGIEKVPGVQKRLIEEAAYFKIPVITATQMLETMIEKPHPTRAEVSDIANAVFDGTDAVMLSGETAIGKYPVEAVRTMRRIIEEAERDNGPAPKKTEDTRQRENNLSLTAIAHAALYAARKLDAKCIVAFTQSGKTVQQVSKLNPDCDILAVSDSRKTLTRLNLLRGVRPLYVERSFNTDEMIRRTDAEILRLKILKKNDAVIITSGKHALPSAMYMISIHKIGEITPLKRR
jgi:pyruvate kinase